MTKQRRPYTPPHHYSLDELIDAEISDLEVEIACIDRDHPALEGEWAAYRARVVEQLTKARHRLPDLSRTAAAIVAYDADPSDELAQAVGRAYGQDTADRNDPSTCEQVIRPGPAEPAPGYELSFVRRMVAHWREQQAEIDACLPAERLREIEPDEGGPRIHASVVVKLLRQAYKAGGAERVLQVAAEIISGPTDEQLMAIATGHATLRGCTPGRITYEEVTS